MISGEYEGVSSYIPDFENLLKLNSVSSYIPISSYIPDFENPNSEIFRYQEPKIKQKYAELWTKIKAE